MMAVPLPEGRITSHFGAAEFVTSEVAARRGVDNTPTADAWDNLLALAVNVLEPARVALGGLHITSGYRCPRLNAAIGGARDSQHMYGEAADVVPLACSLGELLRWIVANTPFDQVIYEFGAWIHVSHVRGRAGRQNVLLATKDRSTRPRYTPLDAQGIAALL